MGYVKSRYNFTYVREPDENVIYNTFSKAIVVLSDKEFSQFNKLAMLDAGIESQLIDNGILVQDSFDEIGFLKYVHYKKKFTNEVLFLTIAPTLDCNFACPYCYENRRAGRMRAEVQDALIAYIQNAVNGGLKMLDVSWYGGEPLLCFDILESLSERITAVTQAGNCLLYMHLVTNGYLLTKERVERLDEIGITRIQITLDGMKANHDSRRPLRNGAGTFDQILSNLSLFEDSPIEVVIRMNVDNQNCSDYVLLKKTIAQLNNANFSVYASPVEDINRDTVNEVSDFMSTDEFNAFTMWLCDECGLSSDEFSVMDERYCFCSAETENSYVVDDLGDFYKCWDEVGRVEYRCFNILEPDDINYSMLSKYVMADPFSEEKCRDCVYFPLCFGGCKFQKALNNEPVCGFTREAMVKYIETAFFRKDARGCKGRR